MPVQAVRFASQTYISMHLSGRAKSKAAAMKPKAGLGELWASIREKKGRELS